MKKLSKSQIRALKLAAKGPIDTLQIQGATGAALHKRGLLLRHSMPGEYDGTNVSYEITDSGLRVLRNLNLLPEQTQS